MMEWTDLFFMVPAWISLGISLKYLSNWEVGMGVIWGIIAIVIHLGVYL